MGFEAKKLIQNFSVKRAYRKILKRGHRLRVGVSARNRFPTH